jgi:hypothetical protein
MKVLCGLGIQACTAEMALACWVIHLLVDQAYCRISHQESSLICGATSSKNLNFWSEVRNAAGELHNRRVFLLAIANIPPHMARPNVVEEHRPHNCVEASLPAR